jgi:hypothetical protein
MRESTTDRDLRETFIAAGLRLLDEHGLPGSVAVPSVCEKRAAPRMLAAARWTLGEMAAGLRQTEGR